jgi:18S rRNA (guanine1575-N7)-methyltransferase
MFMNLDQNSLAKRLRTFFESLYGYMANGSKAVFNFHTETTDQAHLLTVISTKCGFDGGVIVDNSDAIRSKFFWIVLTVGVIENNDFEIMD